MQTAAAIQQEPAPETKRVAVLFARHDSIYKTLPGCDVYDAARDALTFGGGLPVIAHPPCRAWASLRHHAKPAEGEKDYALWAVEQVRKFGGVLEHPQLSTLWKVAALPEPGSRDEYGGWTLVADQNWFGHRARKRTRFYVCGCEPSDAPIMPMKLGEASHTVGLWSGRDKAKCRPSISKPEFEHTPEALARWLYGLALRCVAPSNDSAALTRERCVPCGIYLSPAESARRICEGCGGRVGT